MIIATYATLCARGESSPRLRLPESVVAADPRALADAAREALYDLRLAGAGTRVSAVRDALHVAMGLGAGDASAGGAGANGASGAGGAGGAAAADVPWPGTLTPAE